MSEAIDIPQSAFEPKPLFDEAPGKEIIEEIRAWVKENPSYLWRGHTHSHPDASEATEIRYVNDFVLPKGVESPCPCCTPRHPKFGTGYIAWFPRTKCVRLMGRDCFRTLNPEGHDFAVRELDARIKREADTAFLLANIGKRLPAITAIKAALPIAKHLDDLRMILGDRLAANYNIHLWANVREGVLRVVQRASGPQRDELVYERYAAIAGTNLIDPLRKPFLSELERAARALDTIDLPSSPDDAADHERAAAIRLYTRGINLAQTALDAMSEARLFVSQTTVGTIRTWGALPNATAAVYMRRDNLALWVGKSEQEAQRVVLDSVIDSPIPRLPD